MARLMQTTSAKERVYQQSVSFFSTNESVLTALSASFTGMHGLHESTQTLNKMKEGINQSLETLSEIGGKIQEEALKAGYGPTIRAESVKKLVELGRQLPGALARDHRRDAQAQHPERPGHPRRGRGRQAADGAAGAAEHRARRTPRAELTHGRGSAGGAGEPRRTSGGAPLDDVMLAMDVVDNLRHADKLVERELGTEERDRQLKERLRKLYAAQGIDVPEHILDEGVAALREDRFVYRPPAGGFGRSLALVWVRRGRWLKALAVAAGILAAVAGGWYFGVKLPAERQVAEQTREIGETLPRQLQQRARPRARRQQGR